MSLVLHSTSCKNLRVMAKHLYWRSVRHNVCLLCCCCFNSHKYDGLQEALHNESMPQGYKTFLHAQLN